MADFNRTPEELKATDWLTALRATLVGDLSVVTCHQGSGSTIDLVMVSQIVLYLYNSC